MFYVSQFKGHIMNKNWIFVFFSFLFFLRCASVKPPVVLDFSASQTQVTPGTSVEIKWDVENCNTVDIKGIGTNLQPRGSQTVVLNQTQTFVLTARNRDQLISKELIVVVKKQEIKDEPKKSNPVVEKPNTEPSNYLKGLINIESVKPSNELYLNINLVDAHNFPKEVVLYCTVRDQYGNQIANLAPPYNYNYLDNWKKLAEEVAGKDYYIENFSVQEVREDVAPPYSVSFVLDYSGSMFSEINLLENALKVGLTFLRKGKDEFSIVQFDHRIFNSVPLTENVLSVSNIIPFLQLGGATAFYDASLFGFSTISNSSREKIAILFTDGGDNASINYAFDVIQRAREQNVKIFVIGFNRPFGGILQPILSMIALQTGGKAYFPSSIFELPDIFAEIFRMLNVYYIITFKANKEIGNVRNVKLWFENPINKKEIVAQGTYYVKPERLDEPQKSLIVALFENNKSTLREEDFELLSRIAKFLKENPNKKIKIIGHTDTKGSDSYNQRLSAQRARAVAKKLIDLGVSKKTNLLKLLVWDEKFPIYPQETGRISIPRKSLEWKI